MNKQTNEQTNEWTNGKKGINKEMHGETRALANMTQNFI